LQDLKLEIRLTRIEDSLKREAMMAK